MKVAILHLSDLHFSHAGNPIGDKASLIARAVRRDILECGVCLVAVTGDIAATGAAPEYAQARLFFTELASELRRSAPGATIQMAYVPGNHDCNFAQHTAARTMLLEAALADSHNISDPSVVALLSQIQDDYFAFEASVLNAPIRAGADRAASAQTFTVGSRSIVVISLNTALLTRREEQQAFLMFPESSFPPVPPADLVVALMHHPPQWLKADNAKALHKQLERTADVLLTGHEHVATQFTRTGLDGSRLICAEGAVLQVRARHFPPSGFNSLVIDLQTSRFSRRVFEWEKKNSIYAPTLSDSWAPFVRSATHQRTAFKNSQQFEDYLRDPGAGYSHPAVRHLTLRDIYVYPDLDDNPYESKQGVFEIVSGDRILEHAIEHKCLLVAGPERAGKTSLAKVLYEDLQGRSLVPVLITGEHLTAPTRDALMQAVEHAFCEQYSPDALTRFLQLRPSERVLIVDDLDHSRMNAAARGQLLRTARKEFEQVVAFADDLFILEEATVDVERELLTGFRHCVIRELGHRARGQLIEQWCALGGEFTTNQEELEERVAEIENAIETLLGRNLLPAYPIFVLAMLQSIEAQTTLTTASGSYGYIYEALITQALSAVYRGLPLDAKYTCISRLAYHLFDTDRKILSHDDFYRLTDEYYKEYKMRIPADTFSAALEKALVLERTADGFRFRYRYVYYYFVAKYFQENLRVPAARTRLLSQLEEMTGRVYNEDYANVLIFYIYLTKDEDVISKMLDKARTIYSDHTPCDLDSDVAQIGTPRGGLPAYKLSGTSKRDARDEYRRELDRAERTEPLIDPAASAEAFDEMLKLNVALKTLQIMGQIVRNFPGSLTGSIKLDVSSECYLLGLRTLKATLATFELGKDSLKTMFAEYLKNERGFKEGDSLNDRIEQIWFYLNVTVSHSMIRRIASAVGSKHLKDTYTEVKAQHDSTAIRLVDCAIKLDHYRPVPDGEIVATAESIKKNLFAHHLMRKLVHRHLHLYRCDYKIRQRLCGALDISVSDAKLVQKSFKN